MLAASSCWSLATGVAEPSGQAPIVPSADEATWRSGLSVDALRELVHHGKPSDELSEVGLTIHSFDGSEHYQQPWKPCTADGWCKPFRTWWSASVVNARNGHAVSDSGVLLAPKHTRVLCSAANATALGVDCTGAHRTLSQTLAASLDESALANEVRFDSQHYVRQLPDSVAGFFYFDDAETPELVEAARSQATRAYLAFLREYQLGEADVPLLKLGKMDDIWAGFTSEAKDKAFVEYTKHLTAIWCCVRPPPKKPGHIWYDIWFDRVPHTDRHNRLWTTAWNATMLGP